MKVMMTVVERGMVVVSGIEDEGEEDGGSDGGRKMKEKNV